MLRCERCAHFKAVIPAVSFAVSHSLMPSREIIASSDARYFSYPAQMQSGA